MKTRMMVAAVLFVTATPVVGAQCPTAAADACRKSTDLLSFMTPQLSTALAGGNPTLGQGGVLGGFGHFSIDIRASAVSGSLPKLNNVNLGTNGAISSTFTSKDQLIPFPSVDVGVGLWKGLSLGVTHVLGIDAIVTGTYVPTINNSSNSSDVNFTVNGSNLQLGYGARIGLLEEGALWPGASFAYAQRSLPSMSLSGSFSPSSASPNVSGTMALNNFKVKTSVWRVTAAKNLLILSLSAGFGQDKYDATSDVVATVTAPAPVGTQTGHASAPVSMTRTNYFVGAALNLFLFKLEGEYGQVSGGTVPTLLNNFGSDPNGSRSYFTLGLRFGR
ncbi:MAG: hypothetical protein ACHQQ3_05160 [Gemmatimonadales bacterium]